MVGAWDHFTNFSPAAASEAYIFFKILHVGYMQ